jgi:hypothetical protein
MTDLSGEIHVIGPTGMTDLSGEIHVIGPTGMTDIIKKVFKLNENKCESKTQITYKNINPNVIDVIIYRMKTHYGAIYPELSTDNFYNNHVGISFAMKKKIFDYGIQFIPAGNEDFIILNRIRAENKYNIMISPYIRYFVRNVSKGEIEDFTNNHIIGNRVFIKP